MNWMSILYAAVAGGLAAGIARLFVDPRESKGTYLVLAVLLFVGINFATRSYLAPQLEMRKAEESLQKIPAFKAIKDHDPKTYDKIMAEIRKALDNGQTGEQLSRIVRTHVAKLVEERLPEASDESVANYMSATMDEVDELYARGDDLCFRFLFPEKGETFDVTQYVSKEAQRADIDALAVVIETSAKDPLEIPEESEVMDDLKPIVQEMVNFYGDDMNQLQNPHGPDVDRRKVCEMTTSLYSKILDLPTETSGRLLRYLISES